MSFVSSSLRGNWHQKSDRNWVPVGKMEFSQGLFLFSFPMGFDTVGTVRRNIGFFSCLLLCRRRFDHPLDIFGRMVACQRCTSAMLKPAITNALPNNLVPIVNVDLKSRCCQTTIYLV